ncbi:MAG: hypothetical protein AAB588_06585 [Patescibacteria group bacterium]
MIIKHLHSIRPTLVFREIAEPLPAQVEKPKENTREQLAELSDEVIRQEARELARGSSVKQETA